MLHMEFWLDFTKKVLKQGRFNKSINVYSKAKLFEKNIVIDPLEMLYGNTFYVGK